MIQYNSILNIKYIVGWLYMVFPNPSAIINMYYCCIPIEIKKLKKMTAHDYEDMLQVGLELYD
jgi:hypothetical protein